MTAFKHVLDSMNQSSKMLTETATAISETDFLKKTQRINIIIPIQKPIRPKLSKLIKLVIVVLFAFAVDSYLR